MTAEIGQLDVVTPGKGDVVIAIAAIGGEVILEGLETDPGHQRLDSVTKEIRTGVTATFHEVDVVEGATAVIAVLAGGRAVAPALPRVRHRLGPTRAVGALLAVAIDQTVGTARLDGGHQEDDETSARDQDRLQEEMPIDHDRIATAEDADTPQIADQVLCLPRDVRLRQKEEGILRHEADQSIVESDIREVSRHRDLGALPSLVVVAAVHRLRIVARGQEAHKVIHQMWRMMAVGVGGPAQVEAADAGQRDQSLATTGDGTVPHLHHPPEHRASQLIFLKMNLASRHRNLMLKPDVELVRADE